MQSARLAYALLNQKVETLKRSHEALEETVKADYTLKSDVKLPIRLVYGMAAVILMSFATAVVSLVMKGHPGP